MQSDPKEPSVFEDLLHEARDSAYQYAADQSAKHWTWRILWLALIQFALVFMIALLRGEVRLIGGWILMVFGGTIICGILALLLSIVPLPKKWRWEWRFIYMWQLLFFAFLVIATFIGLFAINPAITWI